MGFLGFGVWGFRVLWVFFGFWVSGFRVFGVLGFGVLGFGVLGFRLLGFLGLGFGGFGIRVWDRLCQESEGNANLAHLDRFEGRLQYNP